MTKGKNKEGVICFDITQPVKSYEFWLTWSKKEEMPKELKHCPQEIKIIIEVRNQKEATNLFKKFIEAIKNNKLILRG